ncbi:MAG: peptidoglycan DD-metalloendopeptidase family protein [Synergistaceae bacterium]|jgi:murein DD-endopeptidase MepM/ murein hydrolase activator NlpD|nr:peptidoglycan DD-metalloendopeptidase family protein [Synergistaceae bacterium]
MRISKKIKKCFLAMLLALTVIFSYSCISFASRRAGALWYSDGFDDSSDEEFSAGYVVVDAIDARKYEGQGGGSSNGDLSLMDDDAELFEEGAEERPGIVSGNWKMITVEAGWTLSKISESNGISIENIMKANELANQHKLREGQILYIPANENAVEATLKYVRGLKEDAVNKLKQAAPLEMTDYVIKNGDTLWQIANTFNLDVNTIFGCNKVSEGDVLKVDSIIKIPNQDGIFITVKKGQTVEKLAKEYDIYPEAILSANRMEEASLKQGSQLFLPGAKVAVAESNGKTNAVASKVKNTVSVKKGFGWPVAGKISSSYGRRRHPVRGNSDFHTGIDIRAPRGRTIAASSAGKVVHAGWMGGYGRTIVISHPGNITTLYGHCSKLLVKVGANVRRGQAVARIGSTGISTGNHVHFEVRSGGRPINPIKVLR